MNKFLMIFILMLINLSAVCSNNVFARGIYQQPEQFISEALDGVMPKPQVYWLTNEDKKAIAEILNHQYKRLRIRYWQSNNETVWILNEVGKDKPITIGVQIKDHAISQLKVLTYRESRGDEVRHSFFTAQFNFAKLNENNELDRNIDGITGATMSVRALTKVSRLALWLDKRVTIAK